jgi:hypothetical protein
VPILNFIDVGPKDQEIKRVIGLRDSLFILKDDGIYRLTGTNGQFVVNLFDSSATILATDSAAVLNNKIYMLSTQGVIEVSDSGVQVVSRPIENLIRGVANSRFDFETTTFGVGYEEDRAYILWLPTTVNDTVATQCYRYNTFTLTWTRWDVAASSGIVNFGDNKLYIGDGLNNVLRQERKNLERQDYADLELDRSLPANSYNITTKIATLSSSTDVTAGDTLIQTQYVTINQFNRLLKTLDSDILLANDYLSSLELSPGEDLSVAMANLVAKINTETMDVTYTFSGTTDFATIQTEFNAIITDLNADSGAFLTVYKQSNGSQDLESPIEKTFINTNDVELTFATPLLIGPLKIYSAIYTDVIYAPLTFGDPQSFKQFREGTIMFEDNLFRTAEVAYKTDLSPSFASISFRGFVNGDWGGYNWGLQNWGGSGNQTPIRTYIPRDKQRGRYIYVRFKHENAYEKFSILGISISVRPYSERAYR